MVVDPMEHLLGEFIVNHHDDVWDNDVIDSVETSQEWNMWRDNLARSMFNEWRHGA